MVKKTALLVTLLTICFLVFTDDAAEAKQTGNCAECHQKQNDGSVSLYLQSAHAEAGISCSRCHGGNASAADKQSAHAGRFVGKPSPEDVISMCGSCHATERAALKASLHFDKRRDAPKVDCVQCHGAHGVGALERNFKMAEGCSNCHGLEYLVALPQDFQKVIVAVDEQVESLRSLKASQRKPSNDLMERRKQLRHMIAGIVHATDLQNGLEKSPEILKLAEEFKRAAGRDKR
jgi:formate-dependent nitrite reductase cytochrome c552 subunit